ncbi:MAG: anti-sigma factor [Verrucomicrobia bacterium]|nr:anti-sigma factor [Verrucomicrobiota bacterium]
MSPERRATRGRIQVILPWAIAACLAIGLFIASADRSSLLNQIALLQRQVAGFQQQVAVLQQQVSSSEQQVAVLQQQVANSQQQLASSQQQATGFQREVASFQEEVTRLQQQVAGLQQQTNLANLKIASLRGQIASLKGSAVTVVWNEAENKGVINLQDVPAPKPGKDYQLWVVDSQHKLPISAGVVPVSTSGLSKVVFRPDQPVRAAQKFVLSLEAAGGAPQPAGPFLFVGS